MAFKARQVSRRSSSKVALLNLSTNLSMVSAEVGRWEAESDDPRTVLKPLIKRSILCFCLLFLGHFIQFFNLTLKMLSLVCYFLTADVSHFRNFSRQNSRNLYLHGNQNKGELETELAILRQIHLKKYIFWISFKTNMDFFY
jgi:hypothetical protein